MTDKPSMPKGQFGTEGKKLWKELTEVFNFTDEPAKLRVLFDACKLADTIKRMDDEAANAPLVVEGSTGQPVIHPCISQANSARSLMATLLSKLGLPDADHEVAAMKAKRTASARKAAQARWKK
ncbi:P27 family phage terminase small subunit [Mycolicibacterium litorale]|uniref:P27 family phage terminase small subunit n=1 Tax=Mycolicibacterium litorale TaxID=758802 RepID=UPI003CEA8D05